MTYTELRIPAQHEDGTRYEWTAWADFETQDIKVRCADGHVYWVGHDVTARQARTHEEKNRVADAMAVAFVVRRKYRERFREGKKRAIEKGIPLAPYIGYSERSGKTKEKPLPVFDKDHNVAVIVR